PSVTTTPKPATAPLHTALPIFPAELATFYEQTLTWEECGNGFDCTDVTVPMDYAQPDGETVTLAVKRRAAGDDEPVGSLLINPRSEEHTSELQSREKLVSRLLP